VLSSCDYAVILFCFAHMALMGWLCRNLIRNTSDDYFRLFIVTNPISNHPITIDPVNSR
jgi:hypothetical protein